MIDLPVMGTCPECGSPVFSESDFKVHPRHDAYCHLACPTLGKKAN